MARKSNVLLGLLTGIAFTWNPASAGTCVIVGVVMDESGSMQGAQEWISTDVLPKLFTDISSEGFGPNYLCSIGFEREPRNLGCGEWDAATYTNPYQINGGVEDGYLAIAFADGEVDALPVDSSCDATIRVGILVTDEERSAVSSTDTLATTTALLIEDGWIMNTVVDDSGSGSILGVTQEPFPNEGDVETYTTYSSDGSGGFVTTADVSQSPFRPGGGVEDYAPLAYATGGGVWNLNLLDSGGILAEAFTNAFISIKIQEIIAVAPTPSPTPAPTYPAPTLAPTAAPTLAPTAAPTAAPTTAAPTAAPTPAPTTPAPTLAPTAAPTTLAPTAAPTAAPTTAAPTAAPTPAPTYPAPTLAPTAAPTTLAPTAAPTAAPTTAAPTAAPTPVPTTPAPTLAPTALPTVAPTTAAPTATPTQAPSSAAPTLAPTAAPTTMPTGSPIPTPPPTYPTTPPPTYPTTPPPTHPEDCLDQDCIQCQNLCDAQGLTCFIDTSCPGGQGCNLFGIPTCRRCDKLSGDASCPADTSCPPKPGCDDAPTPTPTYVATPPPTYVHSPPPTYVTTPPPTHPEDCLDQDCIQCQNMCGAQGLTCFIDNSCPGGQGCNLFGIPTCRRCDKLSGDASCPADTSCPPKPGCDDAPTPTPTYVATPPPTYVHSPPPTYVTTPPPTHPEDCLDQDCIQCQNMCGAQGLTCFIDTSCPGGQGCNLFGIPTCRRCDKLSGDASCPADTSCPPKPGCDDPPTPTPTYVATPPPTYVHSPPPTYVTTPPPTHPPTYAPVPDECAAACLAANPYEPCVFDKTCPGGESPPPGQYEDSGLGCGALIKKVSTSECRYCGFGPFQACPV